jgi:hypothetical protein
MKYRVLVGLDFATNPAAIKRILAGEDVPWKERRMKRVDPGQIVDEAEFPPRTLIFALAKGYIERTDA